jgi:GDPmannose 4,6-dehydratase
MTTALITGVAGQDGSYLADHLLDLGYDVIGLCRRNTDLWRLKEALLDPYFRIIRGDITDFFQLKSILEQNPVDEIYNLAAESFVGSSWEQPNHVLNVNGQGAVNVFEAVKQVDPTIRVYQASSSEMFGLITGAANEQTRIRPVSPYGASKAYAHHMAGVYRVSYDIRIVCGTLFNHESPRRGEHFVTQKIVTALKNNDKYVTLGNVGACRDWGNARDYVKTMPIILNSKTNRPSYVVATGETHSVQEFFDIAKNLTGARTEIKQDLSFCRPCDINWLLGDPSLVRKEIPALPEFGSFEDLVKEMVDGDL